MAKGLRLCTVCKDVVNGDDGELCTVCGELFHLPERSAPGARRCGAFPDAIPGLGA